MNEVIYSRKGLSALYYALMAAFAILGLLLLMAALGQAVDAGPWGGKWLGVVGFTVAGISWLLGAPQMWTLARRYARNQVRIDGFTFSLHSAGGTDLHFALAQVTSVKWNPKARARRCTVQTAADDVYTFDTRACPRIKDVAALIAERSGRPLQIE